MSEAKLIRFSELTTQIVHPYKDAYKFDAAYELILETNKGMFKHVLRPSYVSNCLSTPWMIQPWLPSYKANDPLYNACGFVHDDLYQKGGYGYFSIEDCDDLFRGMLRCAGVGRGLAGLADKFLIFAHTKHHWKCDSYGNGDSLSSLERIV